MNKKNRKGFTIVELVIVIAVIGILATVLVPTFGNVISDAKEKSALQEAKNIYTNYVAEHVADSNYSTDANVFVSINNGAYIFECNNGDLKVATADPEKGDIVLTENCDADCKLADHVKAE